MENLLTPNYMLVILYLKMIFAAFLGTGIKLTNKANTLVKRADSTGFIYSTKEFLYDERKVIIGSALTIALILVIFSPIINPERMIPNDTPFNVWIFQFYRRAVFEVILFMALAFGGWSGIDAALKAFGVADKRWTKALDDQTTIADVSTNTTEKKPLPTIQEVKDSKK